MKIRFAKIIFWWLLAMAFMAGCASTRDPVGTGNRYSEFAVQSADIKSSTRDKNLSSRFNLKIPGSFEFESYVNFRIPLSPENVILVDAYVPKALGKSPVVIIAHGNNSAKEAHSGQAEHLATWGFHVVVVQLKKRDQWIRNAQTIRELASLLSLYPGIVSERIDTSRVLLVGHSFGGSAVALATAQGAPVSGVVLLDPAVVGKEVKKALSKVRVPVMLIGADPTVFRSRQRAAFFRGVRGETGEVTVKGATHDDAQDPSMFSLHAFGFDPFTSESKRELFLKALTASALSISVHRNLSWFWPQFSQEIKRGDIVNPQKRPARSP